MKSLTTLSFFAVALGAPFALGAINDKPYSEYLLISLLAAFVVSGIVQVLQMWRDA